MCARRYETARRSKALIDELTERRQDKSNPRYDATLTVRQAVDSLAFERNRPMEMEVTR